MVNAPVRIALSRPPPQFQAQVVMMGPPPEGGGFNGASREDVMNKEGGIETPTSVCRLKLLVNEALSYWCRRP